MSSGRGSGHIGPARCRTAATPLLIPVQVHRGKERIVSQHPIYSPNNSSPSFTSSHHILIPTHHHSLQLLPLLHQVLHHTLFRHTIKSITPSHMHSSATGTPDRPPLCFCIHLSSPLNDTIDSSCRLPHNHVSQDQHSIPCLPDWRPRMVASGTYRDRSQRAPTLCKSFRGSWMQS